tara:strand:+ start:1523 stop:1759 length:237 start_codon:yes stop_codon:yes gene_type:complete
MVLKVQSVRVRKNISRREANKIVKKKFPLFKVTPIGKNNPQYKNFHSYRQADPKQFVKGSFRIKKITPDILLVLGQPT